MTGLRLACFKIMRLLTEGSILQPGILGGYFLSNLPYVPNVSQATCWRAECKNESLASLPTHSFAPEFSELLEGVALYPNKLLLDSTSLPLLMGHSYLEV